MQAAEVISQQSTAAIPKPKPIEHGEQNMILPFELVGKKGKAAYRNRIWTRNPHCAYCGKQIAFKDSSLDHIEPASKGGKDTPSNLVLSCVKCNNVKDDRSLVDWTQQLINACVATGQTLPVECVGVS